MRQSLPESGVLVNQGATHVGNSVPVGQAKRNPPVCRTGGLSGHLGEDVEAFYRQYSSRRADY
jgi:hypothetical protein